jgi:hypothetical protein
VNLFQHINRNLEGRIRCVASTITVARTMRGRSQMSFEEVQAMTGTGIYAQEKIATIHLRRLSRALGFEVTHVSVEQPDGDMINFWQWEDPTLINTDSIN